MRWGFILETLVDIHPASPTGYKGAISTDALLVDKGTNPIVTTFFNLGKQKLFYSNNDIIKSQYINTKSSHNVKYEVT
jgi:hypothetical protein